MQHINPIDRGALRDRVKASYPVPNFCIDNFLEPAFAESVLAAFPSFNEAAKIGRSFNAVNERGKIQVTDSATFAEPVAELNRTLASPEFLDLMSHACRHAQPVGGRATERRGHPPDRASGAPRRPCRFQLHRRSGAASPTQHPDLLQQGLEARIRRQYRTLGSRSQGLPSFFLAGIQPVRRLRNERGQLSWRDRREVPRRSVPQVVRRLTTTPKKPRPTGPAKRTRRSSGHAPTNS